MQVIRSPKVYDVVVVGSGAGGGITAKVLTEAGAEVCMLEAGPEWDQGRDGKMLGWPYDSPRRGASTERPFGEFDAAWGGWQLDGEPYTSAPGSQFDWFRARMLGGRTNHWGRISLRWGPDDFRRKSIDGVGDDWPFTYDDIKPYYDKLDEFVGIFGTNHAAETGLHNEPDGKFQPPPLPRAYELYFKQAADRLKVACVPARLSILTKPLNGRAACHYCAQCGRGCTTHSNFQSTTVLLPPAMKTGKLTIVTGAMAREVLSNDEGKATGVSYIDTATGEEKAVQGRIVVLAASACESARLLLNSKSARFPNGLANGSGAVGQNLTDSTGASLSGFIPKMVGMPNYNEDGTGGMHLYMPWWLNNVKDKLPFPRGYHIEPGGGRHMPGFGFMGGIDRHPGGSGGGYGKGLKEEYRRLWGATIGFAGRGEMVANKDTYMDIDPNVVDKWGIPVPRFHWKFGDSERLQARHMMETFKALIEEMGGTVLGKIPGAEQDYGLAAGGRIIHEAGVVRLGDDRKASALNKYCQAHEVKNLFVADAGPFVSQADKNLTWTIMALAWRTSEYIAEQRKALAI
ncbi:6'''-hydroxyparomomycin C oxidase [Luteitalea pratensis]|uniref:6'''-hydroxyparomomycin C oxidase n=1 Tax=Luteitalea pratensis TaxID=1855912 RepID=A0A143PPY3_LUTPR|nr:GMC family oxidoreductase [Luteitalea pratensis]AMY09884.1 6'''-hydroxyparomomycin C oxidase [Luteitalea pratensis]